MPFYEIFWQFLSKFLENLPPNPPKALKHRQASSTINGLLRILIASRHFSIPISCGVPEKEKKLWNQRLKAAKNSGRILKIHQELKEPEGSTGRKIRVAQCENYRIFCHSDFIWNQFRQIWHFDSFREFGSKVSPNFSPEKFNKIITHSLKPWTSKITKTAIPRKIWVAENFLRFPHCERFTLTIFWQKFRESTVLIFTIGGDMFWLNLWTKIRRNT